MSGARPARLLTLLGPGILVAATGVGAGDLATAGFVGSAFGLSLLWAVFVGAALKLVLNEGLARFQLATGETLLQGAVGRLGPAFTVAFILYLLPWTWFTCAALMSACGVTAHALLPWIEDASAARLIWGAAHSAVGVLVAWLGGFRVFERIMAACIGVMFVTVVATAVLMRPPVGEVLSGLAVPRIPAAEGGLTWAIALVGGVGGTLTVLCYGYWMREQGRSGPGQLRTCRLDLAVAYAGTACFGAAMLVIANGMTLDAGGARLIVALADRLEQGAWPFARWIFLVGAWAAVFSSLLGVWQAVPYIFADTWGLARRATGPVRTTGAPYRAYLLLLATLPLIQVGAPLRQVQKYYAVLGACFLPALALVLLVLNRRRTVGALHDRLPTRVLLILTLLFFVAAGYLQARRAW